MSDIAITIRAKISSAAAAKFAKNRQRKKGVYKVSKVSVTKTGMQTSRMKRGIPEEIKHKQLGTSW